MQPTDVSDPRYYHKVVDCQWACPAHTNVPEYIRLIAQGRFTDAYLLNRAPTCFRASSGARATARASRPAGAARRRQARRHLPPQARRRRPRDDVVAARCPRRRRRRTASASRCVGAGPASLTVANDLAPLGYEVDDLREARSPGRPDAHQHPVVPPARPGARRGVRLHPRDGRHRDPLQHAGQEPEGACSTTAASTPCSSARARRAARTSTSPAATTARPRSTSASTGSSRSPSATPRPIGEHVLIIGVGNTAMDCCRTAQAPRRHGHQGHRPQAAPATSRPRPGSSRTPRRSRSTSSIDHVAECASSYEGGKLVGMEFERFRSDGDERQAQAGEARQRHPPRRRRDPRHRPGERVPLDRARHRHRVRQVGHARRRQDDLHVDARRASSSAATRRGARRTSSGRSSTATRRPSRSTTTARASPSPSGPPQGHEPGVDEDGPARVVATRNDYSPAARAKMEHVDLGKRFVSLTTEVELGFTAEQTRARGRALPQLRRADRLHRQAAASSATPASTSARWTA